MSSPAENTDKGFSEETCVRCGWRMGQPALNCQNDDTPHAFPSQAALLAQAEANAADTYVEELERRCERLTRERDNATWLIDRTEDRLRDGSTRGETPEIRAWCSQALFTAGPEES